MRQMSRICSGAVPEKHGCQDSSRGLSWLSMLLLLLLLLLEDTGQRVELSWWWNLGFQERGLWLEA